MENKINWNRDKIKTLIELVEEKPCLWNISSAEYHNQTQRRSALIDIGSQLEIPYEELKKKLHTLRAQYSKERTKMRIVKSGSGSNQIYKTKWEFFEPMQYMFQHSSKNETIDSMAESNATTNIETDCDNSVQSNIEVNRENINESLQSQPRIIDVSSKSDCSKKRKTNQSSTEPLEQAALNKCISIMSNAQQKDEYSIFGEYVATEIRLLKNSPDLQFKMKSEIQKIILKVSTENASRQLFSSSDNESSMSIRSPASTEFFLSSHTDSGQEYQFSLNNNK